MSKCSHREQREVVYYGFYGNKIEQKQTIFTLEVLDELRYRCTQCGEVIFFCKVKPESEKAIVPEEDFRKPYPAINIAIKQVIAQYEKFIKENNGK